MNSKATQLCPRTQRQQRYCDALKGNEPFEIPKSIEHEFIQGGAGRLDVYEAHAQVTQFFAEVFCNGSPPNLSGDTAWEPT